MAGILPRSNPQPLAPLPEWQNQYDPMVQAAIEQMQARAATPRYTPEQIEQRKAQNELEYNLGLLGQLSGNKALQETGGSIFKNALAQRKPTISEKGSADQITGEFTYDPDYLRQLDQNKVDAMQKLQAAAALKHDADMREERGRVERAREANENRIFLKSLGGNSGANDARIWRGEDTLRGDLDKITKDTREEMAAIGKLQSTLGAYAGRRFDPIAQQSAVILLNKFLDPGSVVREGEFNRVVQAQGLDARARMLIDQVVKGDILGPEVVSQIDQLASVYQQAAEASMRKHAKAYDEIARRRGFDPANVISDERWRPGYQAPPAAPVAPTGPVPAAGGKGGEWGIRLKGGS